MEDVRQDWTMYDTHDDAGHKLWLLRESFPDGLEAAAYPVAVVVEWNYADDGLPDADTLATLHAFEARLGPLDDGGNSVLVHIIRGHGLSEVCWYTRDSEVFMAGLNALLAGQPRVPIGIEFMDDPDWEYRRGILDNFAQ